MHAKTTLSVTFLLLLTCFVHAETFEYQYGNYRFVYEDSTLDIESVGTSFMQLRSVFTELCGFDQDPEQYLAKVRILPDRDSFNQYLTARIGETRSQYVFLKYENPNLSELVLYPMNDEKNYTSFAGPSLNRQLLLQYLYSYILEPPIWLRDGLQAWVETVRIENLEIHHNNYSPWLETAKNYALDPEKQLPVRSILRAETGTYEAARLYPLSWALVAFFLQTERAEYQRFLHEVFVVLESKEGYNRQTQAENTRAVFERFDRNQRFTSADEDFMKWITGQKTFTELLNSGVTLYNSGHYQEARNDLLRASELQKNDPLPVYYLGLSSYAAGDYEDAQRWYLRALENGADAATVYWALALAAHAATDYESARPYLEKARELRPAKYAEKVKSLIRAMPE